MSCVPEQDEEIAWQRHRAEILQEQPWVTDEQMDMVRELWLSERRRTELSQLAGQAAQEAGRAADAAWRRCKLNGAVAWVALTVALFDLWLTVQLHFPRITVP